MIAETRHGGGTKTTKATQFAKNYWIFVIFVIFVILVPERSPWAVSPRAQQQPAQQQGTKPVFRVGAHFVSVDAYPSKDGKIIEGLTKDDFDIYEDDRPQKIDTFEYISSDARPPDDERSTMLTPRE